MKLSSKGLIGGSFILLIMFNLSSILNLLYSLFMVRMLPLEEYGVLTTLMNIIVLFAIFSESIQTAVTFYVSREKDQGKIKDLFLKAIKKGIFVGLIVFGVYAVVSLVAAQILGIERSLLIICGFMILASFIMPVARGALQGMKKFKALGGSLIVESGIKLLLAVPFVAAGLMVYGSIIAIIIAAIISTLFSLFFLRDILIIKREEGKQPEIKKYFKSVFYVTIVIILFVTIDVVFAKILFDPTTAGAYAVASTLAKIIFIGTQPIGKAMFPLSSEARNEKSSSKVISKSLVMLGIILTIALVFLFGYSSLLVRLYSGRAIEQAAEILPLLGIVMVIISFANIILLYALSTKKTKGIEYLPALIIVQIALMVIFRDSIMSFSYSLIASALLILASAFIINNQ